MLFCWQVIVIHYIVDILSLNTFFLNNTWNVNRRDQNLLSQINSATVHTLGVRNTLFWSLLEIFWLKRLEVLQTSKSKIFKQPNSNKIYVCFFFKIKSRLRFCNGMMAVLQWWALLQNTQCSLIMNDTKEIEWKNKIMWNKR